MFVRKVLPQQRQRLVFGGGHTGVVHHLGAAQRSQAALEGDALHQGAHGVAFGVFGHILDGDVERVQRFAAAGAVGAGHFGALGEQGVQRVQAHEVGAQAGHHLDQRTQVAQVTHAPVARRAQGVELHAGPPPALAFFPFFRQRVGHPAARGRHHHGAVVGGLGGQPEAVVPSWQVGRERDGMGGHCALPLLAVLVLQRPGGGWRRPQQRHGRGLAFIHHVHGGQQGGGFCGGFVGAHGVQGGLQGRVGHLHLGPPEAAVAARQAGLFGAGVEVVSGGLGHGAQGSVWVEDAPSTSRLCA